MPPIIQHEISEDWPIPKLRLRVNDLSSEGAMLFFSNINPCDVMKDSILTVLRLLYHRPEAAPRHIRSVTIVLRSMDGVAHTQGSELDIDHKEIHLSTDYIKGVGLGKVKSEILGVIQHEMVHCFQYDAQGSCPGVLIEDWVRLKAGFVPSHWKRGGQRWDAGYETTAYFLAWLEEKHGDGVVSKINALLENGGYTDEIFEWVMGHPVTELWAEYKKVLMNQ